MSVVLRYYPYLRTGVARHIGGKRADGVPSAARISASVTVDGAPIERTLSVRGPGHVVGIQRSEILRTEPGKGSTTFEPNYFPYVELASADLPWRYTPVGPTGGALQPWLVLVVVERRAGITLTSRGSSLLPVLEISAEADARTELPDLAQSASWVAVQHSVDPAATGSVAEQYAAAPERFVARLICPRDLQPSTSYIAALVPAFDAGRDAGLGASGYDPATLTDAWTTDTRSVSLPVYYSWSFRTGPEGDFEQLVRRLTPQPVDPSTGYRALDLTDPGSGINPGAARRVDFEGALVAPLSKGGWAPPMAAGAYRGQIRGEVNRASAHEEAAGDGDIANDPVVGPPIYGAMATAVDTLDNKAPVWLRALNENPHWRSAAGLGASVVRRQQEALVAGAWDQAGDQRAADTLVRQTRLGAAVGERLAARLSRLDQGALVQLTRGFHSRVRLAPGKTRSKTLHHDIQSSTVPDGMVSAAFRRMARPSATAAKVARAVNADQPAPSCVRFTNRVIDGSLGFQNLFVLDVPKGVVLDNEACYGASPDAEPEPAMASAAPSKGVTRRFSPRIASKAQAGKSPAPAAKSPSSSFALRTSAAIGLDPSRAKAITPVTHSTLSDALRASAEKAAAAASPDTASSTLANAAEVVESALQPASALTRRVASRIGGLELVRDDAPLPDRTWITPSFDEPLYEDLLGLGAELFCPGIGAVSDDVVGLLEVNAEFVVGFLVGANHELARELVWREFPCAPDATFLRQFWDAGPGGAPDIDPITNKPRSNRLQRDQRQLGALATGQGDGTLVLLVRGELLRRYPDLIVYAVEAKGSSQQPEPNPSKAHEPLFTGAIDESTRFWGFDVDAKTARGDDGGEGWFFVIEQQPTAPRFGLDEGTGRRGRAPADRDDWSWDHVQFDASTSHVNLGARPFRGMSSAEVAQATYQRPVRFFAHARTMLPD